MSTPGVSTGTMIIDEPWYGETSGSVTHMTMRKSATEAFELNHLWPLITYSSPSSTARVASSVGSAPAPGSVIEKQLRSSPRSSGCIHRSFCSSRAADREQLGVAGVGRVVAEDRPARTRHRPRISCIRPSLTWPNPPPPSSGGRCAAHRPVLLDLLLQRSGDAVERRLVDVERLQRDDLVADEAAHPLELRFELGIGREVPRHAPFLVEGGHLRPLVPRDGPVVDVAVGRGERHRGAADLHRVAEDGGVEVVLRVGGAEVDAAVGDVASCPAPTSRPGWRG